MKNEEYDERCSYCEIGIEHTVKQHEHSIHVWIRVDNKRYAALERQARRQYDSP